MRRLALVCALLAAACTLAAGADETLQYAINWPSGLSLGEATLKAGGTGDKREFELSIDASIPGFRVVDHFRSTTTADLCSIEFEKDFVHGKKKNREQTRFGTTPGTATRQTVGGGKSELTVPACAHDALAFLFFVRKELRQGRLPPAQTIYYGAPYRIRLEYGGTQAVRIGEARENADRIVASVKGPVSDITFEMFFAKDADRTPLIVRVPLVLGSFSLEIVR
jgi:hypothetical protein